MRGGGETGPAEGARRPLTTAGEAEAAAVPRSRRRRRLTRPRPSQHAPRGSRRAAPPGLQLPAGPARAPTAATAAPLPSARPLTVSGRCGEASSSSFSSANMAGGRRAGDPHGFRAGAGGGAAAAHALSGAGRRRLLEGRGAAGGGGRRLSPALLRSPQGPGSASGVARARPALAGA